MQVLRLGKIPVVVPRQLKFNEHVNDHQLWVSKQVMDKGYPLILCENIENLLSDIKKSKKVVNILENSHNKEFIDKLYTEIYSIIKK